VKIAAFLAKVKTEKSAASKPSLDAHNVANFCVLAAFQ
jgi:hypothetical protein